MRNPNADRIAALSRQDDEVIKAVASQYLTFAQYSDEPQAAAQTIEYTEAWLANIAAIDEPSKHYQERALSLQNLLSSKPTPASQRYPIYREPLMRLLVAVATGSSSNPNPTPAFGSL